MLPNFTKTWNFIVNNEINPLPSFSSLALRNSAKMVTYRNIWFNIKQFLKNNGWDVIYSFDGKSGSPSNTSDQWVDNDSINNSALTGFSSSAGPWIVLRNTFISSNFDILICLGDSTYNALYIAPNGFLTTGATATVLPSTIVTNDLIYIGNTVPTTSYSPATPYLNLIVNYMWSSDLTSYRIVVFSQASSFIELFIDKVPTTLTSMQWSVPFVWRYVLSPGNYNAINSNPSNSWRTRLTTNANPSSNVQLQPITEAMAQKSYTGYKSGYDDFINKNIIYEYKLACFASTSNFFELLCPAPADTYVIPSNLPGTTISDGLDINKFAVFGGTNSSPNFNIVSPWNGSALRIY